MKLLFVLGTRPEAIKMAPLILEARQRPGVEVVVCATGQHREMVPEILALFGLTPDFDLDIMTANQSLSDITRGVLEKLPPQLQALRPDWLLVQGDTSTAFAAALAAFYEKVQVAHVEAGLRTGNFFAPWPEEMNRHLVSKIAALHFAPTLTAESNLLLENIAPGAVFVTGNTGIDALKLLVGRLTSSAGLQNKSRIELSASGLPERLVSGPSRLILITGHRRENIGSGFEQICRAILALAETFPDADLVYPIHPNPRVRETVRAILGGASRPNIHLIEPLNYLPFVDIMSRATLILTDSGGVQEEAPSLGKRVIVLRETTERTEGLGSPFIRLTGCDSAKIVGAGTAALTNDWAEPGTACDLYGDGFASRRILDVLAPGV